MFYWPHSLVDRIQGFGPCDRGSIPRGAAFTIYMLYMHFIYKEVLSSFFMPIPDLGALYFNAGVSLHTEQVDKSPKYFLRVTHSVNFLMVTEEMVLKVLWRRVDQRKSAIMNMR